ncbi:MAG: DUF2267 domain-containing protein [Anaerolineaceae bacterium]|nr:DUF2267 domain-containing protein [Anaerolineaceae bacterium]
MKYNEFVGHVQNRARLGTQGEAVTAIRATLETLAERISTDEAHHLAAQLPREIGYYLKQGDTVDRFSLDEFFERVAGRAEVDLPDAAHHARTVVEVLSEAVSPSQLEDVRGQLPQEFSPLFTSGSQGQLNA